jgi:hypothetical protein
VIPAVVTGCGGSRSVGVADGSASKDVHSDRPQFTVAAPFDRPQFTVAAPFDMPRGDVVSPPRDMGPDLPQFTVAAPFDMTFSVADVALPPSDMPVDMGPDLQFTVAAPFDMTLSPDIQFTVAAPFDMG